MIKLVVFDLDGTITQPHLDFKKIRRDLGIENELSILDHIDSLDEKGRERANAILDRHEKEAAHESKLTSGAHELFAYLKKHNVATAIFTRNARENVHIVLEKHGLSVDDIITRNDGPVKPSPEGVFSLCRKFGVRPGEVLFVGDYLFDIQTGVNAGTKTALLKWQDTSGWDVRADYEITTLVQVIEIIEALSR
jgi:HAD superfamily hydrolase (TIGR01549 family)